MNRKAVILMMCIAFLLIACNSSQTEESETAFNESEEDMEDSSLSLPEPLLQKGDKSEEVESLQEILISLDYPIENTGVYDDNTTWALTDIQLQSEIQVSGLYDEETKEILEAAKNEETTFTPEQGLIKPKSPDEFPKVVENPYDVLALINKNHALPGDYEPEDLVIPDVRFPFEEDAPKKQLRQIAADALEELFAAGDDAGVTLFAQSGYRSYDRQEAIFASNAAKNGEEHANTYSARAGQSEHQSGLVMDVTAQAVGFDLVIDFGETEEGKWINEHAHEFGFIIRYPEGKEDITLYQYEPWHLRYVGEETATAIYENDQTFEEYLGTE